MILEVNYVPILHKRTQDLQDLNYLALYFSSIIESSTSMLNNEQLIYDFVLRELIISKFYSV